LPISITLDKPNPVLVAQQNVALQESERFAEMTDSHVGSLIVVGTGIKAIVEITFETQFEISNADQVFYLVADQVTEEWIKRQNPRSESLYGFYAPDKDRAITYQEMVDKILAFVRMRRRVCAAFYGHPGVFAYPAHEAIRRARAEGFYARMLPAVSSEDCLFSDLGVDPGNHGCQSFEASYFLINSPNFDPATPLILWQLGVIGERNLPTQLCNRDGLRLLVEMLLPIYSTSHTVFVYEASQFVVSFPKIDRTSLGALVDAPITPISTLFVPPKGIAKPNRDILNRLYRQEE